MSDDRRIYTRWLLVIVLMGSFALRIFRLDWQSLWWDEGISLHLATSSLGEILANRVVNIHPPLYFIGLKGWVLLTGATPFAARYSSTLMSFIQVAAIYAVARHWYGRSPATWIATGLIAISPISVIYGQEVRVYACLSLIYLALLAIGQRFLQPPRGNVHLSGSRFSIWFLLALVELIGIHLHYVTLFVIGFSALWLFGGFFLSKRWRDIRHLLLVQLLVGLGSAPWFFAVARNWTAVQAEANAGTYSAQQTPLDFLITQVWTFHLTGLAGAMSRTNVLWLSGLAALGLLFLLVMRWRYWRKSLPIFANWLVPLSLAFSLWSVRSFSHPRYIIIFAIGLILLISFLIGTSSRLFQAGLLGLPFIFLSLWGLGAYFFDPGVAKDDMRGVARYLESAASSNDLIIVPDTDWSLFFEYDGETRIVMPDLEDGDVPWSDWQGWSDDYRRVFVVDYPRGTRDWQRVVPFALEKDGLLSEVIKFDGLVVRLYELERPLIGPILQPVNARFGPMVLDGSWVEMEAPTNNAITAAFRWRVDEPVDEVYQLSLKLMDIDGWSVAVSDSQILDVNGRPTNHWDIGQPVTTYHLLPLAPGTPPLAYTMILEVYSIEGDSVQPLDLIDLQGVPQGHQLPLTEVQLTIPVQPVSSPYLFESIPLLATPLEIAEGLTLLAVMPDREILGLGQPVYVQLLWKATSLMPDLRPRLILAQNGIELAAAGDAPAYGRYSTAGWTVGEMVLEHRRLTVPSMAMAGNADLVLYLEDQRFLLDQLEIVVSEKKFDIPAANYPLNVQFGEVARLIGYDLPMQEFTTLDSVPLTLYWESLISGTTVNYTVFSHILAEDGRLVGQHDSPPGNGRSPTQGWLPGEYIIDLHEMTFREKMYIGEGRIEVGFYDPTTGTRLRTGTGEDAYYLPVTIQVRP